MLINVKRFRDVLAVNAAAWSARRSEQGSAGFYRLTLQPEPGNTAARAERHGEAFAHQLRGFSFIGPEGVGDAVRPADTVPDELHKFGETENRRGCR